MKQFIYADGLENVSLAGGMVRLDLFHLTGSPAPGSEMLPREVDQQLVMTPAAFVRAFSVMQRFVDELEKKGVVSRAPEAKTQPKAASSPNFS